MSESEKDTKINRLDEERMPLLPNGSGEKKNVIFYGEQPVHISYLIPQQIPWYKRIWRRVQKWSLYELMTDKTVMLVIISFGISGFCIIGFSELSSLWMATKSIYGGLNFTTDKIGIALLVPAIFAVIIQPIIFARFERKFGGIKTLQVSLIILCIFTLLYPFVFYVLERKELLWTFLIIAGMFRMVADISSRSALALFINNSVYPEQAGRVNGLAFSIQEIMRVASPTLFGAMFSWAINENKHKVVFPLDYRLPFIVIGITIFGILLLSICLPKNINRAKQLDEMLDTIHLVEHNNTTIQPAGVAIRTSQVAEDTSTTNNN